MERCDARESSSYRYFLCKNFLYVTFLIKQRRIKMPFIIIFVLIPLAEIYAFISVGEEIGVLKTLLLCLLTAVIGGLLVKKQGMETIMKVQASFRGGILPLDAFFDGICLVIAGALLLTPGFVTDIVGFSLLLPIFRQFLRKFAIKSGKFSIQTPSKGSKTPRNDDIIEGQYENVSNDYEKLDK